MAVGTLKGMLEDINTMDAMANPANPRFVQVHIQMAQQGMIDYANGGQGLSGGLNAFNRYNPLRSPFEAVSGEHLIEGPQLGERLTGGERATQWASTVSLAASLGTGAPGTMSAVSGDLRALSSFGSLPRTFAPGELMPNGQLAGVGPGAMFRGETLPSVPPVRAATPNGNFYSVAYQTKLSPSSYPGVLRPAHFQEANEALLQTMEGDPQFAQTMQQAGINLQRTPTGLAPRTPPPGWTWHHAEEPGMMQLVPRVQHTPGSIYWDTLHPGGQGGYAIWGQQ
jgi:hypothetical protein